MRKFCFLVLFIFITACDLRQQILDAPAGLGEFIAHRVPALLAEPDSEIYEYASVIDYGESAPVTPQYGTIPVPQDSSMEFANLGDYMNFVDVSDYDIMGQARSQIISSVERDYGTLVVQEKKSFVLNTGEHVVQSGETAFSISQKYNMPLARLVVINELAEPYALRSGQVLRVENAKIVTTTTEMNRAGMISTPTVSAQDTASELITIPPGGGGKNTPTVAARPAPRAAPIRAPQIDARAASGFIWPVRGRVVSEFGPKSNGLRNDGINIAAPLGTDIVASDNGVIAYAGNELKGMGNLLIIQHQGGWMTVYAHLDSFVVRRGDRVRQNQKIGTIGRTGKVAESQLHFEIRKGSQAFDPRRHLK